MEKPHIEFLALNLDFDCLSLEFLGLRKPAHGGIKQRYPRKNCYFSDVGQSSWKQLHRHGHAACHNKH